MRGKVQKQQREEEKQRHKEKRRREMGEEKKKKYTCDSSETRRIKRIHRGNVNMHHRFDRIPVRIIPFLFRRWPIHSRRISFCPFIRFLHFAVCNLHAAAMIPSPPPTVSPSTYARTLIELSQTFPFLRRYETTILEIYPEILSFLSRIYIYIYPFYISLRLSF